MALACSGSDKAPPGATATLAPQATGVATLPATATLAPGPLATPRPLPTPPADARPFPPDLKAEGEKILTRVAELRGTPSKAPIQMNLVGRRAAIEYYRRNFDEQTRRDMAMQQDVYQLMGLIPRGTNITDTFLNLLGIGILGFYDPLLKAFFLLDDIGGLESGPGRTTVAHELAHALQDQYYDIDKLERERRSTNDWDGLSAFLDVVEGDAVATEGAFRNASARRAPCFQIPAVVNLPGIPFVIYRELNTWYEDGFCFVDAVYPDVSKHAPLFENLPTTTEQVLHPDKYKAGERAIPVALPALEQPLGAGWSETARANFGEFTMQNLLVLGLRNDRGKAQQAAAGWGGDGWVLYSKDDARFLQISTVWDTPGDAREFFAALEESFTNRSGAPLLSSEQVFGFQLDKSFWRVGLSGDRVVMLVATDQLVLDGIARGLGM